MQNENLACAYFGALKLHSFPWINGPGAVQESGNKVLQLSAARNAGLRIPETLISNRPEEIRSFCADGISVIKNLATPWLLDGRSATAAYTVIADPEWIQEDSSMISCPAIYQRFSKRACDYRVVMIGEAVFAARCVPQAHQEIDVRRGASTQHGYRPCEFDTRQLAGLKHLLGHFGLSYCSADFMEDTDGNLYFLDLNSCGAWWWVDDLYHGQVRTVICDHIEDKLSHI
jgi:glutathione synthase/RimK-type ligase-like ATP-grasp enzyme